MRLFYAAALTIVLVLGGTTSASAESALPKPIREFIASGFGKPSPVAPQENRFFTTLVGVWTCAYDFDGQRAFPATWAFKHSVGGFAVEHLFFQAKKDLVPPFRSLNRDLHALAITFYDPNAQAWRFTSASNVPSIQTTNGQLHDGKLILPSGDERDVFANVTTRSFEWLQEQRTNHGWETGAHIFCDRLIG